MKGEFKKITITIDNVDTAQAIALKKFFEHMEYLGNIGASRWCSFFADGDGNFRPKVTIDYPEELPELKEASGVITADIIKKYKESNKLIIPDYEGNFKIDFDSIAWLIYH